MQMVCEGKYKEKPDWFKTINTASEKLYDQELRNAIYTGTWLSDAKRYFSKNGCAAQGLGSDYMTGSPIRQEYPEAVIDWISNGDIEGYMALHQHDPNAGALWQYYSSVINWVKIVFPKYRREMKGVAWGPLYNACKEQVYDAAKLEAEVARLMQDEDVTRRPGIYAYLLTGAEKHLSIRAFTPNMKREAYERQAGICPVCKQHYDITDMEADHITPWHSGGKTAAANCQMLCQADNRTKGGV